MLIFWYDSFFVVQPHEAKEDIFLADEFASHVHKRAIEGNMHRNRYVETLVVVDKKMIRNHGEEKITPYVLTVLNMVGAIHLFIRLTHM